MLNINQLTIGETCEPYFHTLSKFRHIPLANHIKIQ
jgi:hypothetical protein